VGDVIPVVITGFRNERPAVSHKKALRKDRIKSFIADFKEEDDVVLDVKITGKNKGGFIAENKEGIEFFLPRSQAAVKDMNALMGKSLKVKIIKIDNETESIIVSRKKFLDDERKKRKEIVQELIDRDEVVEGTIKKITTYGMFVDVGGIDGLVHYSEISYKGPVNPGTLYKEGEVIPVKAIKYDKDKRHLSLSVKAAMPDPWDEIKDELETGDSIQVTISNIEPYGAFVDLGNDIEGFLHISEISWDKNIKHPRDYIEEGQVVDVEVIEIDAKERRLRVSLKNVLPKPFDDFMKKFKVGDVVKGEKNEFINNLTTFAYTNYNIMISSSKNFSITKNKFVVNNVSAIGVNLALASTTPSVIANNKISIHNNNTSPSTANIFGINLMSGNDVKIAYNNIYARDLNCNY
jgi:small subunit ribosomal protein S1